jgi:hypothetical protein
MSWGYTFFPPKQLPLTPEALSDETVGTFVPDDLHAVQTAIAAHLPQIAWTPGDGVVFARGKVTEDDADFEFTLLDQEDASTPTLIVGVRCSGRIDSEPFAQRLCDATGWIAFDDRAYLFQPNLPPMSGGGG